MRSFRDCTYQHLVAIHVHALPFDKLKNHLSKDGCAGEAYLHSLRQVIV
jgi:hypothetical protein